MNSEQQLNSSSSVTLQSQLSIKLYKYRWVILFIYILIAIINFMQVLQFSIISNIIRKYYHAQDFLVDLTCLTFFITYILLFYPASYFIENHNLRFTMIISAVLTLFGNLLKLLGTDSDKFWIILLAQTLIAIAQVFLSSITSKLATTWFGSKEVSTACAAAVLGIQLGTALGCIQSTSIIKNDPNQSNIKSHLFTMFLYQAIASACVLVTILAFFRSKPNLPPTQSQLNLIEQQNNVIISESFYGNMKAILHKRNFWFVIFSLGLANGMWNANGVLLSDMYLHYFPNGDDDTGLIALISIICGGCINSVILGFILDKTPHFKVVSIFILTCSTLSFIGVIAAFSHTSRIGAFIAIPIFGFFITPVLIIGFEYLVEITYPIPESCSASMFNTATYIFAILITFVLEAFYGCIGYFWTMIIAAFILGFCIIMGFFIQTELKRRNANLKLQENGT